MLSHSIEEKVKAVNVEFELIMRNKLMIQVNLIVFLTLSVGIMIGGYLFGKLILDRGVFSAIPLIIIGIGLVMLPFAFGPFNKFRNKLTVAKSKKQRVDEVLALYGVRYTFDVSFGKEVHGSRDVKTNLSITQD